MLRQLDLEVKGQASCTTDGTYITAVDMFLAVAFRILNVCVDKVSFC